MPKKPNADIGTIPCPTCTGTAAVRRMKNRVKLAEEYGGRKRHADKLYIYCSNGCGRVTTNNQDWIRQHATFSEPVDQAPPPAAPAPRASAPAAPPAEPPPATGTDPLPPPPAEPAPAPKPKRRSIFEGWEPL